MTESQVNAGQISLYAEDLRRTCKPLTKAEEARLAKLMRRGDISARQQLVEAVLPWTVTLAKKYIGRGIDFDDLVSIAALKVAAVIHNFDPKRGRLTTFAAMAVKRELQMHCQAFSTVVHKPRNQREATRKLSEFSCFDIGEMDIDVAEGGEGLAASIEHRENVGILLAQLDKLPARESDVIRRRMAGEKLHEIGPAIGVTKERVRQIEQRGIERLREAMSFVADLQGAA